MKRLKVIGCEVFFRELSFYASQANTIIDFTFMPRNLHVTKTEVMQKTLQEEIDKVDTNKYDAIILSYGLCGGGVVGLHSSLPIIIPKATNCISIFLGSQKSHDEFMKNHPKSFFFTSGWIEREINPNQGLINSFVEMYNSYKSMIDEIVLINTHVGNIDIYREMILDKIKDTDLLLTEIESDNSLFYKLLNCDWDEEFFTIIPPNHLIMSQIK